MKNAKEPFGGFSSLARRDSFRAWKWEGAFPDPDYALKQINGLLGIQTASFL